MLPSNSDQTFNVSQEKENVNLACFYLLLWNKLKCTIIKSDVDAMHGCNKQDVAVAN